MSEFGDVEKLCFLSEWFDSEASIIRKFLLSFFPSDCTVELFDLKNHKLFLKRTQCNEISRKDVYVGNTIKIFSRQIKIVDCADTVTRKKLDKSMQRTFGLIKPDGILSLGEILCTVYKNGFQISNLKMTKINKDLATRFYNEHQGKPHFPSLVEHVSSGPVVAMDLLAEDAVNRWAAIVGPMDPAEAKTQCPSSIRASLGTDNIRNVIHSAKLLERAEKESELFFGSRANGSLPLKPVARLDSSTCCVIKPHAVREGLVGNIVCMIEKNDFIITGMQMFYLDEINAAEFLEVYDGVVPEYKSMVKQLSSGPCVALEVRSTKPGSDVVVDFRKFAGPFDPEIARQVRPNTIRAHFGKSIIENAVHATYLPEDAKLEVEYFFKILPP